METKYKELQIWAVLENESQYHLYQIICIMFEKLLELLLSE